jgi:phosphate transport system protein
MPRDQGLLINRSVSDCQIPCIEIEYASVKDQNEKRHFVNSAERGDHCKNIAEEIIFYIEAKVLKHASKKQKAE